MERLSERVARDAALSGSSSTSRVRMAIGSPAETSHLRRQIRTAADMPLRRRSPARKRSERHPCLGGPGLMDQATIYASPCQDR